MASVPSSLSIVLRPLFQQLREHVLRGLERTGRQKLFPPNTQEDILAAAMELLEVNEAQVTTLERELRDARKRLIRNTPAAQKTAAPDPLLPRSTSSSAETAACHNSTTHSVHHSSRFLHLSSSASVAVALPSSSSMSGSGSSSTSASLAGATAVRVKQEANNSLKDSICDHNKNERTPSLHHAMSSSSSSSCCHGPRSFPAYLRASSNSSNDNNNDLSRSSSYPPSDLAIDPLLVDNSLLRRRSSETVASTYSELMFDSDLNDDDDTTVTHNNSYADSLVTLASPPFHSVAASSSSLRHKHPIALSASADHDIDRSTSMTSATEQLFSSHFLRLFHGSMMARAITTTDLRVLDATDTYINLPIFNDLSRADFRDKRLSLLPFCAPSFSPHLMQLLLSLLRGDACYHMGVVFSLRPASSSSSSSADRRPESHHAPIASHREGSGGRLLSRLGKRRYLRVCVTGYPTFNGTSVEFFNFVLSCTELDEELSFARADPTALTTDEFFVDFEKYPASVQGVAFTGASSKCS